jgi:2-keto-4-pentenoate hydratase
VHVAVDDLAHELDAARRGRAPIAPLSERVPDLDLEAAYAVQAAGLRLRQDAGEQVVGGKLGFTSRAMQAAMGVDRPNRGWLTDTMLVHDGVVRLDQLIHPKVEPEIAFLLGRDLVPPVDAGDVLTATRAVAPCLEVVDSRFRDFRFALVDNVADDSSAGQVVLGAPVSPEGIDLALVGCTLWCDGQLVDTAAGAAALDHPAAAVAWMANTAEQPLRAGHVVISGGLTAPLDLAPGSVVSAGFDRIGRVELVTV